MARLDSTLAWHGARRMVMANRDVLVAVAGVFFLLPGLVSAVVLPLPEISPSASPQAMADAVMQFYTRALPVLALLSLPMLAGFLTMLALLIDRERPTVGRAIALAARLVPGYFAAQVMVALGLGVLSALASGVLAIVLPPPVAVALALPLLLYPLCRVVLVAPAMVAARRMNPVAAVIAALVRTRGEGWRILCYFGPALVLFGVVYALVMIMAGVLMIPIASETLRQMLAEAVGAVMLALGYTWYAALVASTWLQLAAEDGAA